MRSEAAPLAQIKRGGLVRFAPEGSGGLCRVCSESGGDAATVRHRDLTSGNGLAPALLFARVGVLWDVREHVHKHADKGILRLLPSVLS
jgi:hypothetical protein